MDEIGDRLSEEKEKNLFEEQEGEEMDEEESSSSPLLSESSTIGTDECVQFLLETGEDEANSLKQQQQQPTSNSTLLFTPPDLSCKVDSPVDSNGLSTTSDINNNDRCIDNDECDKSDNRDEEIIKTNNNNLR